MYDKILEGWLAEQHRNGLALALASDLLDLSPIEDDPPTAYLAHFSCKGLIRVDGQIKEWDRWDVGINFLPDYQQRANPFEVITLVSPLFVSWHPNISNKHPVICVGRLPPGPGWFRSSISCLPQIPQLV